MTDWPVRQASLSLDAITQPRLLFADSHSSAAFTASDISSPATSTLTTATAAGAVTSSSQSVGLAVGLTLAALVLLAVIVVAILLYR